MKKKQRFQRSPPPKVLAERSLLFRKIQTLPARIESDTKTRAAVKKHAITEQDTKEIK